MKPETVIGRTLAEVLIVAHQQVIDLKTELMAGDGIVPFLVFALRDGKPLLTAYPFDRDKMLWTVHLAVGAFSCDQVVACADTYRAVWKPEDLETADPNVNPETGEQFLRGDLAEAFKAGKSWVTEAITSFGLDRATRKIGMIESDYRVTGKDIDFASAKGPVEVPDAVEGTIPDALRRSLAAPDMMAELIRLKPPQAAGLTVVEQRAHIDAVALRMLAQSDVPVFYLEQRPDITSVVTRSMRIHQETQTGQN